MEKHHRFHPEVDNQEIVDLILAGWTGRQICQKYGFTDAMVVYRVEQHTGMTPSELRKAHGWVAQNLPPELAAKIVKAYSSYKEPRTDEVAEQFGVTDRAVRLALTYAGVPIRSHRAPPTISPDQAAKIVSTYKAGVGCVTLGERYKVSERQIRRILEDAGVERRRPGTRDVAGV